MTKFLQFSTRHAFAPTAKPFGSKQIGLTRIHYAILFPPSSQIVTFHNIMQVHSLILSSE
jgi:hypothetical protein